MDVPMIKKLEGSSQDLAAALANIRASRTLSTILGAPVTGVTPGNFSQRLEKFIDDTRKGRGVLGSSVPSELNAKVSQSSQLLALTDPSSLQLSNAYSTAFSYDKKARFLSNVSDASQAFTSVATLARSISTKA